MSGRILLVEDDASIATVITAALEDEGMLVHHCESIAGRDRFLAAQRFDAMLTDVILADGDGIASLVAVRALDPDMPVIVLSAQNRSEEHTSELQSLMRISYAVFCLKKNKIQQSHPTKLD